MALEKIGLGGVLTFDSKQAVSGMSTAGRAADRFKGQFNAIVGVARQVGAGIGQAAQAMRGLGVAALPATLAFGVGVDKAQSFEKQMSAVQAVSQATAEEMKALTAEAKRQGATTAFSATQAGEGLENLARAGFTVTEQIAALGPVLNAASADGIDLATSADIIANTLRAMNLPATDAARAADVLALTSAKSNTNMISLGEAMKFAAPQAHSMNIELEQLAAVLGAAADAGLKGTLGGTSFTQAMVKLLKPSKEGQELINKFNLTVHKTADGFTDIIDLFKQVSKGIKGIEDPIDQARTITELFGVRGQKAISAVMTAIDSGKLDILAEAMKNAEGAADRMAKTRLDNLAGAFVLLQSAAEGFALETAGLFLGPMTEGVQGFTKGLSDIVLVLQELNSEEGLTDKTAQQAGSTIVEVARGIKDGIELVIDAWRTMRNNIVNTIKEFTGGQSPEMIRQFTKIATVVFLVAAAVAPLLVAFGGFALFITSVVIPAISAIGTIAGAIFTGPVLIAIGVAIAAFAAIRRENESIGQTFSRVWNNIVAMFKFVQDTAVKPFIEGFRFIPNAFDYVQIKFDEFVFHMRTVFGDVIAAISQAVVALKPVFQVIFRFIGNYVGAQIQGIMFVVGHLFNGVMAVGKSTATFIKNYFISVVEAIVNLVKGAAEIAGKAASLVGLDFGRALQDFGRGEFRVQVGVGRGIGGGAESSPADAAAKLAELEAQKQSEGMFTPGDIDSIASAVGSAVGANVPKEIEVNSKVCVDGKTLAKATSKHRQEINERAGFRATPWQRRAAVEHGAAPVGGA